MIQRWVSYARSVKAEDLPRLWGWMVVAVALVVAVSFLSPQQIPVMLYKLSMITASAVIAYWIDRSLFKESGQARFSFDMPRDMYSAARLIGRAIIYLGTVLGVTLGL